jgi:outer membrane protein insertion porin family
MRMLARAAIGLLVLVLLTGVAPRHAAAQDDIGRLVGRPVASVAFEVEGRPVVLPPALVSIKTGDPFRLDVVREMETRLLVAGGYEDVQVAYTDTSAGLALLFRLTPRHPVTGIQFKGDTGLSETELRNLVTSRYAGIPAREQPAAVARVLERLMQDEGFPTALVESEVVMTHDPDRATLVLTVTAGPRSMIARTNVEGVSPMTDAQIIKDTRTEPGQPFRRAEVESRLADIEDALRRQEYYRAVAIIAGEPQPTEGGVLLNLQVDAGPKVTLAWEGMTVSSGLAEDLVPLRRLRSVDEDLLEDSDEAVVSYLRGQGYREASATHTRVEDGDRLVITMKVTRGLRYVVDALPVTGNAHVPLDTVRDILGVEAGQPYSDANLINGIRRLKAEYLRLGYYLVGIEQQDVEEVPGSRTAEQVRVRVPIAITEGPLARIGRVTLTGVSAALEPELRGLMESAPGAPYIRERDAADRARIETFYRDRGFESVAIEVRSTQAQASIPVVDVTFDVTEGPQIFVGDISVVGNERVSENDIRDEMVLKEGEPFGEANRRESQRRLIQMGVFRQVAIDDQARTGGETVAHVVVRVEEVPPNSVSYGGGVEGGRQVMTTGDGTSDDRLFFAPRGFFQIVRRNLFGKNRSIDFFTRVAPRPATNTADNFGFLEYRASTTYREPRAFHSNIEFTLGLASEQVARTGFNYARRSAALQILRPLKPGLVFTARYGLEHTRLFDVDPTFIEDEETQIALARLYPTARLTPLSSGIIWDRRDAIINPSRGTLASADVEVAGRAMGSQVGYAKVFMQASGFRPVNASRRTILAGRAELGLARGFARVAVDANGDPLFDEGMRPIMVNDLPISQRFFSGGGTTVRGFQRDRLGRPEVLTKDGLSIGGNGVLVFNGEVRTAIGRLYGADLGLAVFVDTGNVFQKAGDIDLTNLRQTIGFGFRYLSPLGPIRLDFGFKTDRQTYSGGGRERGWEYHFNIGEAF